MLETSSSTFFEKRGRLDATLGIDCMLSFLAGDTTTNIIFSYCALSPKIKKEALNKHYTTRSYKYVKDRLINTIF
tara:strand:+ start:943 stop:1167 length:225 start_codon:yes stop_codon:yes gene_type:complete